MPVHAISGRLLLGEELVLGIVVVDGGQIAQVVLDASQDRLPLEVFAQAIHHQADIVAPGFVDLQVNGGFGCDMVEDPAGTIATLARRLPESGVTGFLPTLITSPRETYRAAFAAYAQHQNAPGARPLGLHLEGPFLSPRRPGAHRLDLIEAADEGMFEELLALDSSAPGTLRLMTLAPERPGAVAMIRRLRQIGVVVSLGHTDAALEQFRAGVEAGATMATHLFNAMAPFDHRSPNALGAALLDRRIVAGLIADGVHSHPASLELAVRARGADGIALVSDMMAAAGMPDGRYHLGDRQVESRGGAVHLEDGTLAGSVLLMDQAVRNMVRWTSATVPQVLRMAGEFPARVLSLSHTGRLTTGLSADLVLLDDDLQVQCTMIAGEWAYRRANGHT